MAIPDKYESVQWNLNIYFFLLLHEICLNQVSKSNHGWLFLTVAIPHKYLLGNATSEYVNYYFDQFVVTRMPTYFVNRTTNTRQVYNMGVLIRAEIVHHKKCWNGKLSSIISMIRGKHDYSIGVTEWIYLSQNACSTLPNFKWTVEVWEWIRNFIPRFIQWM